ncbi:hypothetical protein K0M31_018493 [Melipona bicolor]|nr:hypothetical protein K0M31_018493 [Melipona bicolor]
MEARGDELRTDDHHGEDPFLWAISRTGAPRALVTGLAAVARYCADRLPKKMSLDSLRMLAVFLIFVMPRSLTYLLLYPIFRLVFGNLYPAYASYKAVRTKNVKEYVKWMMYWIVFALFTCAETFTDVFFSFWFPFYYEIKTILVIWLLSPATKGSSILYRRFVHPALIRREAEIDEALARATEQSYSAVLHLGSKGVNYATTVLMQTAIKHILPKSDRIMMIEPSATQWASPVSSSARPPTTTSTTKENADQVDNGAQTPTSSSPPETRSSFSLIPAESIPNVDSDPTSDKLIELVELMEGGGGLVQHLKKSYSLSDLTGEKEDENRNTPHMHDETDMEVEPRRREHVGRRGYSPRRTQSSSNRVELYFSEVDVDVRQPRSREPTASLTNIRSSDDISSGYSSGEALQSSRTSQGDSLVRTSSVGARTRAKPRSATKKTPEDSGEDSDSVDPPSSKNVSFPTPLNLVTPEQALEILLLLSQNSNVADHIKFDRGSLVAGNDDLLKSTSQSGPELEKKESTETVDNSSSEPVLAAEIRMIQCVETRTDPKSTNDVGQTEETVENRTSMEAQSAETEEGMKTVAGAESDEASLEKSARTATDELCQDKFEELKQLLNDAHKAVNNIVHTQENLRRSDASIAETSSRKGTSSQNVDAIGGEVIRKIVATDGTVEISPESGSCMDVWTTPSVSRSNSDSHGRAGKYNKKPAPKAPLTKSEEDLNSETDAQSALKATLVIKTGTLKTFSNTSVTKDVFIAHAGDAKSKAGKKSKRQRTKEGFSKLLTIPKNIFHGAFSKEPRRGEDSCSDVSAPDSSSNSVESQEAIVELAPKLSSSDQEINAQNDDKSENDSTNSSGSYVLALGDDKQKLEAKKDAETTSVASQIREMSQSPRIGKRLE